MPIWDGIDVQFDSEISGHKYRRRHSGVTQNIKINEPAQKLKEALGLD